MLKSLNYIVIKCTDCQETMKIQPGVAFKSITHECKKAPVAKKETVKAPVKDTATASTTPKKVVKKPATKKD